MTQGIAGALPKRQRAPFLVKNTDFMYVLCALHWRTTAFYEMTTDCKYKISCLFPESKQTGRYVIVQLLEQVGSVDMQ